MTTQQPTQTSPTTQSPTTQTPSAMETSSNASEMSNDGYYGWFSAKSASTQKKHIYSDKSGKQVVVTCVSRTVDHGCGWDDIVSVGKVYKYLKSHTASSNVYK